MTELERFQAQRKAFMDEPAYPPSIFWCSTRMADALQADIDPPEAQQPPPEGIV